MTKGEQMPGRWVQSSGSRTLRIGLAVAAFLLIVGTVSTAGAAPRRAAGPPVTVKRSYAITLATGDRVVLNVLSTGAQTASVDNSAARSRASVFKSFHSFV